MPLWCQLGILLPATHHRVSLLVAVEARLAPGLQGMELLLLSTGPAVPLDVALLATPIASSVILGVVSSGLLVVAPFLLGVNTPIRIISGVEQHLLMMALAFLFGIWLHSCSSEIIHVFSELLDRRFSWRALSLGKLSCGLDGNLIHPRRPQDDIGELGLLS